MRVIAEDGENLGVLDNATAQELARQKELDLILINPQAVPPIAKITSWSKFKYELSKKHKGNKPKGQEIKEMWFKPFIETGDLEHKVERVKEFIAKGHKVKLTIRARGYVPQEKMYDRINEILTALAETAEPESNPKMEGRNMIVFVKGKK